MNNTINKPFGFPYATGIISDTYGNGDKAVYTRATEAGEIFRETNGCPVKVNDYNFNDVTKVECAKDALIDLCPCLLLWVASRCSMVQEHHRTRV